MKVSWLKKFRWCVLIGLFSLSCSDNNLSTLSDQLYYPIHVNSYWDYSVTETNILQTVTCADGGQTIGNYQLRMVVTDSVKNSEGGLTFIIHRYKRSDATMTWSDLDTWSVRFSQGAVVQTEGNISFVKFYFPLSSGLKWNGNIFNDLQPQDYLASEVGKSFEMGSNNFQKTVTVVQSNYDDFFISRDMRNEVYAFNIGLVYKKIDQRTYFQDPCYGQQKIQKGLLYEQSLIAYGKL